MRRRRSISVGVVALLAATGAGAGRMAEWTSRAPSPAEERRAAPWAEAARELRPGWTLSHARTMPETVCSLAVPPEGAAPPSGEVYVGTTPDGGLYRFNAMIPEVYAAIGLGLGDRARLGTCAVDHIAWRDLDRDGRPELLATTSQVSPRGRPRLYAWSADGPTPILRGMARPEIASSWSHGLGFLDRPDLGRSTAFVTYCGYGEIVEFDLRRLGSEGGFGGDLLSWKKVGQLPASGEWTATADVDGDGLDELCVATGFAPGKAALHVYRSPARGADLELMHVIDEGRRFANVRFLVGDLRGDGSADLVAWWDTDHLYEGDCEIVRYRLDESGVSDREVIGRGGAGALWPDDGQTALIDADGLVPPEVWFTSNAGSLWRYDPGPGGGLTRILRIDGGLGPVAGGKRPLEKRDSVYVGRGRDVLRVDLAAPAEILANADLPPDDPEPAAE